MSCLPVMEDDDEACANCGAAASASDIVKLKSCTACLLVKYCGVDCQRAHRKQHKKACKQRAAELKDERLYSEGQKRPEGDFCPICTLPIPIPMYEHSVLEFCCMKRICDGCNMAAQKRGMRDCPFCRIPLPANDASGDADNLAMLRARVVKKDPDAINVLGEKYYFGDLGLHKDTGREMELWTEAAQLGSTKALYNIGVAHHRGEMVDKDEAKASKFCMKAAMQGCVEARYNLGNHEGRKGNYDRAVRHFLISAKMGDKRSIESIKMMFAGGLATKEYAEALRGCQDAVEEMKSHDRDEAKRLGSICRGGNEQS